MKATSKFACITLLACVAIPAFADSTANQYVYIRSNINQPWGQETNEDAMDSIFGVGNWVTMYFESIPGNSLFASSTKFIFMEGGDSSFTVFQAYMEANRDFATNWIRNGGRLLILAAPNDPLNGAELHLPDEIVLHSDPYYESAASSAYAIDISNPIFSGPNATTYSFSGDFVSHGYFTGDDLNAILLSNLNEVILGEDVIGSGLMVFGGLTTDNFQLPQPAAHSFLKNIIYHTAFAQL